MPPPSPIRCIPTKAPRAAPWEHFPLHEKKGRTALEWEGRRRIPIRMGDSLVFPNRWGVPREKTCLVLHWEDEGGRVRRSQRRTPWGIPITHRLIPRWRHHWRSTKGMGMIGTPNRSRPIPNLLRLTPWHRRRWQRRLLPVATSILPFPPPQPISLRSPTNSSDRHPPPRRNWNPLNPKRSRLKKHSNPVSPSCAVSPTASRNSNRSPKRPKCP
mmetsp:Transcript_40561/g.73112  ORF Transcript_40561/g.73112 Transcript_40561/m.73112 type:complete len:214 (+) Transcript_40561:959-1600(+)